MKILPTIGKKQNLEKLKNLPPEPLQLDLGLKESPLNRLFEVRQRLEKIEDRLKLSNYWKNPLIWVIIFFPLVCAFLFYRYYLPIQSQLPDQIPLIWSQPNIASIFLPKTFLIIIPAIVILCSWIIALLLRFSYRKLEKFVYIYSICFLIISLLSYISVWRVVKIFIG